MLSEQAQRSDSIGKLPSKPSGEKNSNLPAINLPRGGGAIRGIGEKFAANPVTGTGSMSVPIATSPGRSGFGPQLSLSYDSGAGNGPFGFGWSLSLPAITRKTDKGLPKYVDEEESDVFILSGAEDLVPEFKKDATGKWIIKDGKHVIDEPLTIEGVKYLVRRYRPRIEGLFARIERWSKVDDPGDVHWRSVSKDNVLTLYGKNENSRIFDPDTPHHIFSWLICETRDDKGNAILYKYKKEDGIGVDLTQAHERNRGDADDLHRKTNRYLKHIRYGNRKPLLDNEGHRPHILTDIQIQAADWMFEVVFDYGEHDINAPKPNDSGPWTWRSDPFSSYRAGFEVRTRRRCKRVLMFHHFRDEANVGYNCLVRSTDFGYSDKQDRSDEQDRTNAWNPVYSFLLTVTQTGYKRQNDGYLKRSLPPVEFKYTQPIVQDTVQDVDAANLENLPIGVDGAIYQWTDLHGEGIPGILTEQAGVWFYKRNLSPISEQSVEFAPLERVAIKPNLVLTGGQAQFMDLAGDGQPDLVVLDGPVPGLYEHEDEEGWQPFRPFTSRLNRDMNNPNLKFVDLDGDGHADVLISEDDTFVWHPSLAELGFGLAHRVYQALDEEKGPRLVFADGTQSIYLADLSGDGLTDLVRIRNGEVCYWPNLGYGRFGAKVSMDCAPHFDHPDQFDHKRIRLADIDGTGTTDIIYLHRDGVRLYFNQSGNSWSAPQPLRIFPGVDDLVSIVPTDLLGNGTACLVWSSPLPGDARRPMRYVNLMGGQKPHLLIKTRNNLGAETHIHYAPSTKFYLEDKRDGKPWITRLPFPVHVVERVETYDYISRNRFVTHYAYHHGYFDGEEREFRGFGMVEQWDTEEFGALTTDGALPEATNLDDASHVPPVLTRTWFHTGLYVGHGHVSDFFAGLLDEHDRGEYYREPAWRDDDTEARKHLLPDTVMPPNLTLAEEREACRALKGSMLRQEVYALDGTGTEDYPYGHPYTVTEQNFTIRRLQPHDGNRHAVFFTHPREAISYHYERNPTDPRISHALTLDVDDFGNVLRSLAIGYPRANVPDRQPEQNEIHLTLTLNRVANRNDQTDWYRVGLPVEMRTYEVVKPPTAAQRFTWEELSDLVTALVPLDQHEPPLANTIPYEQWDWRKQWDSQIEPGGFVNGILANMRLRLIEHVRTFYRPNDLGTAQGDPLALLPLGIVESLALPGESYKLAFTPGLLTQSFKRKQVGQPDEDLLPIPAPLLEGKGNDQGGYVAIDGNWWITTGRVSYSDNPSHTATQELTAARTDFFLPRRYRNPFGHDTTVTYDGPNDLNAPRYNLLVTRTSDILGNTIAAVNDYRVLQPRLMTDPNRNRTAVAFDALGMVVATAVMGGEGENLGDLLEGFDADPLLASLQAFIADPQAQAVTLLGKATTRIMYDLERYQRVGQPPFAATLARETHYRDSGGPQTKIQIGFSYSDGFGREIQKKIQAETGNAPQRQASLPLPTGDIRPGDLVHDAQGKPVQANTPRRWVGSGRTVFNNKGKPVRQYEPFFSATHLYEPESEMTDTGVSPILFYDPVERVIATLHPNHTYGKVVFDPWRQTTYDVNDTIAASGAETGDPRTDPDIKGYVLKYFETQPATWRTWHAQHIGNQMGTAERDAAQKAAAHANTPTVAHFDTLGRPFLTLVHNGFKPDGMPVQYPTRVHLDIEGNQREVRDAIEQNGDTQGRIVMRYDYDMLSNRIHQASMEAGERWVLNDVAGDPIRTWDSRRFLRRMTYDKLRRPTDLYVTENGAERLAERTNYGESQGDAKNHRTRVYQVFDGAGIVTSVHYDFKGNLKEGQRELLPAPAYKRAVDWNQNPIANDRAYINRTTYDALNRPTSVTMPDNSVYCPTFNEANMLNKVDVNLRGAETATPFVTNIDYNAKGQRERIVYGSGVQTTYEYDPLTFRLIHLKTTRPADPDATASQLFQNVAVIQDLYYTYDPVGNITRIEDAALKTAFHNNQPVEPVGTYTYDALYRLIEAKGREHVDQSAFQFNPPNGNYRDYPFVGAAQLNNPQSVRNYTEQYMYDPVGNFEQMSHQATSGEWTRYYAYDEPSLIEPDKKNNRLSSTSLPGDDPLGPYSAKYSYRDENGNDVHGCMTRMSHLAVMNWDFKDQLQMTQQQVVNIGPGERTYYVYDAAGQRVRKVTERQNGTLKEERICLGGYEIFRQYNGSGTPELERETLHIMDDKQRIALVETKTLENGAEIAAPTSLTRYQFGNHLGSASVELDKDGALISYEEYYPYGSTSYQAARSATEVSLKRYRYTRMERDEESGLSYHGARYYALWLARWISPDKFPCVNKYVYCNYNPIGLGDFDGNSPSNPDEPMPDAGSVQEVAPRPQNRHVSTPSEVKELMDDLQDNTSPNEDAYTTDWYEERHYSDYGYGTYHIIPRWHNQYQKGDPIFDHDDPPETIIEEPTFVEKGDPILDKVDPPPIVKKLPKLVEVKPAQNPQPKVEDLPKAPPPPPPPPKYTAREIHFEGTEDLTGKATKFADESYMTDINNVVNIMKKDPEVHVTIEAYVGYTGLRSLIKPKGRGKAVYDEVGNVMDARAQLVQDVMVRSGIPLGRIRLLRGAAEVGEENRKVEFHFFRK